MADIYGNHIPSEFLRYDMNKRKWDEQYTIGTDNMKYLYEPQFVQMNSENIFNDYSDFWVVRVCWSAREPSVYSFPSQDEADEFRKSVFQRWYSNFDNYDLPDRLRTRMATLVSMATVRISGSLETVEVTDVVI